MSDSVLLPWMKVLIHEVVEPFTPKGSTTEYCKFCMTEVTHELHGKDDFPGDAEISELREKFFSAKRRTVMAERRLTQGGLQVSSNDLQLKRVNYLLEMLLSGSLEDRDRLMLETGWAEQHEIICSEALELLDKVRQAATSQGLLVPENPGGLIVPGENNFRSV